MKWSWRRFCDILQTGASLLHTINAGVELFENPTPRPPGAAADGAGKKQAVLGAVEVLYDAAADEVSGSPPIQKNTVLKIAGGLIEATVFAKHVTGVFQRHPAAHEPVAGGVGSEEAHPTPDTVPHQGPATLRPRF